MKTSLKISSAFAAAIMAMASSAHAQSSTTTGSNYGMYSLGQAYIGLNAGQSNYRLNNGVGGFAADQRKSVYSIYGGSYFSNNFGLELGYTNFDRVNRAGGSTRAEGFNLSLVGKLPFNESFSLLGRVGTTYGRTDVSSNPASGIASGKQIG